MVVLDDNVKTIGSELRALRVAKGLSLSDMSQKTKLQVPYIQGIEEMNRDALPSIGYVLGFVRTYAKALGYDADRAVAQYKTDTAAPKHIGMRERALFVSKRKMKLPRGVLSAATVLLIAGSISFWYASHTKSDAEALREAALSTSGNFEVVTAQIADPNIITVKALSPSWVRVTDKSGKTTMSRILVTGEVWRTELGSGVSLQARDGGALEVFRGGISLGVLGDKGVPIADVFLQDVATGTSLGSDAETTALPLATGGALKTTQTPPNGTTTKGAAYAPDGTDSSAAARDAQTRRPSGSGVSSASGHATALESQR